MLRLYQILLGQEPDRRIRLHELTERSQTWYHMLEISAPSRSCRVVLEGLYPINGTVTKAEGAILRAPSDHYSDRSVKKYLKVQSFASRRNYIDRIDIVEATEMF